jgi:hypothetical protein
MRCGSVRKSLWLALPLAGFLFACDEGQEKALAQCKLRALETYKSGRPTRVSDWGPYYNYLVLCMKTKNFTENATRRCTADEDDLTYGNHYCYEPDGLFSNLVWRVRITFDGGWERWNPHP